MNLPVVKYYARKARPSPDKHAFCVLYQAFQSNTPHSTTRGSSSYGAKLSVATPLLIAVFLLFAPLNSPQWVVADSKTAPKAHSKDQNENLDKLEQTHLEAQDMVARRTLSPGEELVYDVRFMAVKLGTIKIITLADTLLQNNIVYHAKVFIQSNENIPFYSLKTMFNSLMDTSLTEGRFFEANTKEGNKLPGYQKIVWSSTKTGNSIRNQKWYDKQILSDTVYQNVGKVLDGSTLFFFARKNAGQVKNVSLPTIMDLEIANTKIKFTNKIEKIKIKAIKEPVKTYFVEGNCEWKALYGLGGQFQGWFSADSAAIPIKAKMNVYIGSIDIELTSWKRTGWAPPCKN